MRVLGALLLLSLAPLAQAEVHAEARVLRSSAHYSVEAVEHLDTGTGTTRRLLGEASYRMEGAALRLGLDGPFGELTHARSVDGHQSAGLARAAFDREEWQLIFGARSAEEGEFYGGFRAAKTRFAPLPATGATAREFSTGGLVAGVRGVGAKLAPAVDLLLGSELVWLGATWREDVGTPGVVQTPGIALQVRIDMGLRLNLGEHAGVIMRGVWQGYVTEIDRELSADFAETVASVEAEAFLRF